MTRHMQTQPFVRAVDAETRSKTLTRFLVAFFFFAAWAAGAGMFLGLDESAFREDLSSTSIREGTARSGL